MYLIIRSYLGYRLQRDNRYVIKTIEFQSPIFLDRRTSLGGVVCLFKKKNREKNRTEDVPPPPPPLFTAELLGNTEKPKPLSPLLQMQWDGGAGVGGSEKEVCLRTILEAWEAAKSENHRRLWKDLLGCHVSGHHVLTSE